MDQVGVEEVRPVKMASSRSEWHQAGVDDIK